MNVKSYFFILLLFASVLNSFAQEGSNVQNTEVNGEDLLELSLEALMNITIHSASKKEETLFDAPLSSHTITRAEIINAGVTSIPEALRLAPGVIVREMTNGMYDIHLRGMDNIVRNNVPMFNLNSVFFKGNSYTLIMVDNRPVFNHLMGGTFWEALPVDLNDVERIEVVRGPASPLFGPNAVTGVINIITRRMGKPKTLVNANVQGGTVGTSIANITVGRRLTDKLDWMVSGNFQDRRRFSENYYIENEGRYGDFWELDANDTLKDLSSTLRSRALHKWGINSTVNYRASEKINAELTLSTQRSYQHGIWDDNPLQYGTTHNTAANLAVNVHALKVRSSYLRGYNLLYKGSFPKVNKEYDSRVVDAIVEYDHRLGNKYTITPGISWQNVEIGDVKYRDSLKMQIGSLNATRSLTTLAGFVRADLNFTNNLRVIAGLRADKFSAPDTTYLAYELAATYKINSKHLIRAAATRSNSGSFMGINYTDYGNNTTPARVIGDKNVKLLTINLIELGYRAQLTPNLQLDLDIFQQKAKDFYGFMIRTFNFNAVNPHIDVYLQNIPPTATQRGATLSVNYVPNEKIQFKPFVTFQYTRTKNLPSLYIDPNLAAIFRAFVPGFPELKYTDVKHEATPTMFGGAYLNYKPVEKLNINLNASYYSKQVNYDGSWSEEDKTSPAYAYGHIKSKFIVSAKISYEIINGLNVFANARNLTNNKSLEFYAGDFTKGLYLVGASYNFNK